MQEEKDWLLLPLPLKHRIFGQLDRDAQKALTLTCRNYNGIFRHNFLKEKIYSVGIIADGLLDAAIFKQFPLDYQRLYQLITRINPKVFQLSSRLDYQYVWPLVAFLGMDAALVSLIGNDPLQKDANGYNALTWLALGGHKEVLMSWIERCYGAEFSCDKEPELLKMAVYSGSQDLTRYLHEERHYKFDWRATSKQSEDSALHDVLKCGHRDLFRELVLSKAYDSQLHEGVCLALTAAKYHHWDISDSLIDHYYNNIGTLEKAALIAYSARDDLKRFLRYVRDPENTLLYRFRIDGEEIDLEKVEVDGQNLKAFAIEGGHEDVINLFNSLAWLLEIEEGVSYDLLDIAAKYGHIHIIDKFHDEVRSRSTVYSRIYHLFNYASLYGDWNKYQYLIKKYPPGNADLEDRRSEEFVNEFSAESDSDLHRAVENGHLYFAQRFIQKYGDKLLLGESGQKLIEDAKVFGRPIVCRWVNEQVEAAQLRLEKSTLTRK